MLFLRCAQITRAWFWVRFGLRFIALLGLVKPSTFTEAQETEHQP
jgi:hypothetical protein